jgi:hypothetical protein
MNEDYLVHSTCKRKNTIELKRDTKTHKRYEKNKRDTKKNTGDTKKTQEIQRTFFYKQTSIFVSVEKWKSTLYFIVKHTSIE